MRLLFVNKMETNAGWGFETFLDAEIRKLGIETICLDYHRHRYETANYLLSMQQDFDGVLVERGTGYAIPTAVLKSIRRPRLLLFTELVSRHPAQQYLFRDGIFDHVFLRSQACIEFVQDKGWLQPSQVELFLSAISPDAYFPADGVEQDIDLLFVGAMTPRRQEILADLQREFPITIASAFGPELVSLIHRTKIVLNIHAEEYLDTETRIYETLSCGGFLITERLSQESPFTSGVHLVEAGDIAALRNEITNYLPRSDDRKKIADAGLAKVLAEHTMQHRAQQLNTQFTRFISPSAESSQLFDRNSLRRASIQEQFLRVRNPLVRRLDRLRDKLRS